MINQDSDGLFEGDGEDRRELAWTESEWEKYLAEHDSDVRQYLNHYDQLTSTPDRIDEVARRMNWELEPVAEVQADESGSASANEEDDDAFDIEWEPYTLHRNPVYIATRALYVSLLANWKRIAVHPEHASPGLAMAVQASLYNGRENALQAVQALDLGDYALAICFFKRALRALNDSLAHLANPNCSDREMVTRYRDYALPRFFDLREIWLRVMGECRDAQGDR